MVKMETRAQISFVESLVIFAREVRDDVGQIIATGARYHGRQQDKASGKKNISLSVVHDLLVNEIVCANKCVRLLRRPSPIKY